MPFARGTFGIAQRLDVPVVPVTLRYRDPALAWCDDAAFLPHYVKMAARPRVEVELVFGAAMPPRPGELPEDMAARARNVITKNLRTTDAKRCTLVSSSRPDAVLPARRLA